MNSFDTHRVPQTQPFADEPETVAALLAVLSEDARDLPSAAQAAADIATVLRSGDLESPARFATERLATLAAVVALRHSASAEVAEAFARTRLLAPRRIFAANYLPEISTRLVERTRPLA